LEGGKGIKQTVGYNTTLRVRKIKQGKENQILPGKDQLRKAKKN